MAQQPKQRKGRPAAAAAAQPNEPLPAASSTKKAAGGIAVHAEASSAPKTTSSKAQMERSMAQMLERKPLYPAELAAAPSTVCVTGGTSYIGACIVARLLASGHNVHATCRQSAASRATTSSLDLLPGAAERLRWFHADMLESGSYDEALVGCKYVIHTACPVDLQVSKSQAYEWVIKPALQGVQNLLDSVNRAASVEKVIVTSSIASLISSSKPAHQPFTEADWNLEFAKSDSAYYLAKTMSEWLAWAIAGQQKRWRLITILPGYVAGPPVVKNDKTSSLQELKKLMDGSAYPMYPPIGVNSIDVDDVAAAHTLAMVQPQAHGRYLLVERGSHLSEVVATLRELFPEHAEQKRVPHTPIPSWLFMPMLRLQAWWTGDSGLYDFFRTGYHTRKFDCSKAWRELGLDFLSQEQTLMDTMDRLMDQGMLQPLKEA